MGPISFGGHAQQPAFRAMMLSTGFIRVAWKEGLGVAIRAWVQGLGLELPSWWLWA